MNTCGTRGDGLLERQERHAGVELLLVGCFDPSGLAVSQVDLADIQVDARANPKFELSGYRTYAWAAAATAVRDPDHEWTPTGLDIASEIVFLVDRELREKGRAPTAEGARKALSGNLCRCTGYGKIIASAVAAAREELR